MVRLVAAALCTVFAYVVLRQQKPEFAPVAELAGSVVIFFVVSGELVSLKQSLSSALSTVNVDYEYIEVLLKTLAAALITQFAADTARDNGLQALASKIEFAGRVIIIGLALPVFRAVLQFISQIIT